MTSTLSSSWTSLGYLPGGAISAVTVVPGQPAAIFAATPTGLYRSFGFNKHTRRTWTRLNGAPFGIVALAASPAYAADQTLFAGEKSGLWRSSDGGDTWQRAELPFPDASALTLAISPNFGEDGFLVAGTLEHGLLLSTDRGETWASPAAGIPETMLLSLALSPAFAQDGLAFASTEEGLYRSRDRAQTWEPLPLPDGAAPVLSLALSSDFAADHTLYAGSEAGGIYRSPDLGQTWQRLALDSGAINALLVPPGSPLLFAAAEQGLYRSADRGETWSAVQEIPDVLSLAADGGPETRILAGAVDAGLWLGEGDQRWRPVAGLPARAVVSLALSDAFDRDGTAFMVGEQDGLWRTRDGGRTWQSLNDALPTLAVTSLAIYPQFHRFGILAVATDQGVLLSRDRGDHWQVVSSDPANLVAFSALPTTHDNPLSHLLTANFPGQERAAGIRFSLDLGESWQSIEGPWDEQAGQMISLAVSAEIHYHVAFVDKAGAMLNVWHGNPNMFERVVNQPAGDHPVVSFWCPEKMEGREVWYLAVGQTVLQVRTGFTATYRFLPQPLPACPGLAPNDVFLDITGVRDGEKDHLFVTTGRAIHHSAGGPLFWALLHDFGPDRAIQLVPSPAFAKTQTLYGLLIGGVLAEGKVE